MMRKTSVSLAALLAATPALAASNLMQDVAHGGTGGHDAPSARAGIGAAALGANSDITSLLGLTGLVNQNVANPPAYLDSAHQYYVTGFSANSGANCNTLQFHVFSPGVHSYVSNYDSCQLINPASTAQQIVGFNAYIENPSTASTIPIQGTSLITNTSGGLGAWGVAGVSSDVALGGVGNGSATGGVMTITSATAGTAFISGHLLVDTTATTPVSTTITADGTTTNTACGGVQCTGVGGVGTYAISYSGTIPNVAFRSHPQMAAGLNVLQNEFDIFAGGPGDRSRNIIDLYAIQPTNGNAIGWACTLFLGTYYGWDNCLTSGDGSATNALYVGYAYPNQTNGPGQDSSAIKFAATDNVYATPVNPTFVLTPKYEGAAGLDLLFHNPATHDAINFTLDSGASFSGLSDQARNATLWTTGATYPASLTYTYNAGNIYSETAGGTAGSTPPTCTSGTCSDGTITWTYYGPAKIAFVTATGANTVSIGNSFEKIALNAVATANAGMAYGVYGSGCPSAAGGQVTGTAADGLFLCGYGSTYEVVLANRNRTISAGVSSGAGAPFVVVSTSVSTSTVTGSLQVNGGEGVAGALYAGAEVVTGVTVFGSLPACNAAHKGARHFITDGNSTTFLTPSAGGGANNIPVICDGTSWKNG